jgi:non-ribosomal peptide synthetase component F
VLHNVLRYTTSLALDADDRLTLLQSPAFSGAVSSTYSALLNGATLCPFDLVDDGGDRLADWLVECGATVYHSVPSIFRALVAGRCDYPALRIVRLEGDRAIAEDARLFSGTSRAVALWSTVSAPPRLASRVSISSHTIRRSTMGSCRSAIRSPTWMRPLSMRRVTRRPRVRSARSS